MRLTAVLAGALLLLAPASAPAQGRRGRAPQTSRSAPSGKQAAPEEPLANLSGLLKAFDRKSMILEDAEANTLEFRFTKKTRFFDGSKTIEAKTLQQGDRISVEARRDLDGSLEAVNVRVEHPKQ